MDTLLGVEILNSIKLFIKDGISQKINNILFLKDTFCAILALQSK